MKANQMIREVEIHYKTKPNNKDKVFLKSAPEVVKLFRELEDAAQETLIAIHVDTRLSVSCFQVVSIGTATQTITEPATILRTSLLTNSNGLFLIHNHPTGNPSPSREDIETRLALSEACKFLNVSLLDFIILGDNGTYYSFAEEGILDK